MNQYSARLLILSTLAILWIPATASHASQPGISELVKQLNDSDPQTQMKAIDLLGKQGPIAAEAVPGLTKLLQDASPLVRAHAAQALGRIGAPAKAAVERLASLIGDPDGHVRRAAVRALHEIRPGAEITLPLFVKKMQDADHSVRIHAMNALAELGGDAVPFLVKALEDEEAAYWACLVISEIGPKAEEAVPKLVERLKDRRPEVRREVILALAAIGKASVPAVPQLVEALGRPVDRIPATYALVTIGQVPQRAESQIEKNAQSDDELLSSVSTWALARLHPADKDLMRKAVEHLVKGLQNREKRVRRAAAQALVDLDPDPEIARPILAKAMDAADPKTLDAMMDALAGLGEKAIPRLVKALEIEQTRARAAAILGRMGPAAKEAVPALTAALCDKNCETRSEVLMALGAIGPDAAAAVPSIDKLLKDPQMDVCYAACYALGKIGPAAAAAAPELAACLKAEDEFLRMASAWALGMIDPGSPETAAKVVPVLITALDAPDAMTRMQAAEVLGRLGPRAQPAAGRLKQLASEEKTCNPLRPNR
ncbi:MAG: HEAT repeat domain-containing protein [Pirellulales bacterium]|nr:HEAT repeat domain-containing protein [Pirellulales bacterium]